MRKTDENLMDIFVKDRNCFQGAIGQCHNMDRRLVPVQIWMSPQLTRALIVCRKQDNTFSDPQAYKEIIENG